MDLIHKQPVLISSLFSIAILTVLSGIAVGRLQSWEAASAQGETSLATDSSFACEPLVFTLSATDESTPSASPAAGGTATSPSPTTSATPSATTTGTVSPSPTATTSAQGGVSPSPTSSALAQTSPTGTATVKPSATATTTKGGTLPDAGISTPTLIGIAAGIFLLLAAALFALK